MTNRAGGDLIWQKLWWWSVDKWDLANSEPVSSEREEAQIMLSHINSDSGDKDLAAQSS